tara:strand:- start:101 stop:1657 length:1557 start_codon:yes stop_codon:yes gene_type:complete
MMDLKEYQKEKIITKIWKSFFLANTLIILAVPSSFSQNWGGGNRASTVVVESPIKETLSTTKEIQGKVVSSLTSTISSVTNGIISMENIKVGDTVKKNQLIASQDSTNINYNLKIKKNQLANANISLEDLINELKNEKNIKLIIQKQSDIVKSKYERTQELYETNAISVQELETATSAYLSSQQQVLSKNQFLNKISFRIKQAENSINRLNIEINKLEKDISDTNLKSPIDGQIVDLSPIQTGYVRVGERLATIQSNNNFEIELEVPAIYLDLIKESKEVKGLDIYGENVSALYRATLLKENPRTGTRTVRLKFKDKIKNSLQANNASINMFIPTSNPEPVITISKDAIIPISSSQVVFIMEEGKAIKKSVKLGGSVGNKVIIISGISTNDKVIVRGNELLKDGSSVKLAGKPSDSSKKPSGIKGDKWVLKWQGRGGERSGELILGKKVSTFNGEKTDVETDGKKLKFETPLVLPFGTITLNFNGNISSDKVEGILTLKMPNGNENEVPFSGSKVTPK